jgi:predicted CXXCH cytochrome family protein
MATVGGDCDVCHNIFPGMMEKTHTGKAFQYVLKNEFCVNCHSNTTSDTIKILGGNRVPVVHSTVPPINPLAGGNFFYVAKDFGDRKGHNVDGITSMDMKFRNLPPGYGRKSDPSYIGYDPQKNLMCAGSNGCHGDRNIEDPFASIMGTHHALDKPLDGSTIARSYRFLKNTSDMKGVTGIEDRDWNRKGSAANHNEYSKSIDLICTGCHGDYHNTEKKKGAWFRHPVGVPVPSRGDYLNYTSYNTDAPVARETLPAASGSDINHDRDSVMCLSCHVAHASPYESMLRWDYDKVTTEGRGGCNICHSGK